MDWNVSHVANRAGSPSLGQGISRSRSNLDIHLELECHLQGPLNIRRNDSILKSLLAQGLKSLRVQVLESLQGRVLESLVARAPKIPEVLPFSRAKYARLWAFLWNVC